MLLRLLRAPYLQEVASATAVQRYQIFIGDQSIGHMFNNQFLISFNLLIGFNVYSEVLILSLGSTPVAVVGSPLEFQHHCGGIVQNLPGSCHKSLIYWTPIVHCVVVLYVYIRKKWVLPEQFHIFCQRLLIFSPNCSIIVQVTALIRKQLVTRNVHIPSQFGTF